MLEWLTASEQNNEGFEIQRSPDPGPGNGLHWEELSFLPGNGTTTKAHEYSFLDEKPLPGMNYYRLRQVDFDGGEEFSPVQAIDFPSLGDLESLVRVFPNPVRQGELTLYWSEKTNENTSLCLYSATGHLLLWQLVQPFGNTLDVSGLAPGIYLLEVTGAGAAWRERVVVAK